jgi:Amt family ammonium transporter
MLKTIILFLLFVLPAFAGDTEINKADTLWVIISSTMVLFMLPGLALFYSGMVRAKNTLSTSLFSFVSMTVVGVLWFLFGHTIAFGPNGNSFIGGMGYIFFSGNILKDVHGTIPEAIFAMFQGMFAIITVALVSGSVVERIKFSSFIIFISVWSLFVYAPLAHWVWGDGGWLGKLGVLDFAGGIVVHFSSATAALALILALGDRKGFMRTNFLPHNLMWTLLGTGMLWFGWFGFNAGSALAVDSVAVVAFVNTMIAGAAGGLVWMFLEWKISKPSALGISSGIIAGLASVTNAAGFVTPLVAFTIGIVAGIVCYYAILLKFKFKYDDSLDVIGIHGVGGVIGAIFTGLFVSIGGTGFFGGNPKQLGVQILGLAVAGIYSFGFTYLLALAMKSISGIRVDEEDETLGLDLSQHGESAYNK